MSTVLIAPTEPLTLRKLGTTSSKPEKYGADILIASKQGLVGIQRKEISDLIASVHDGRLQRELPLMKKLTIGVLLVEGKLQWTNDGILMNGSSWTKAQHLGLLWSTQSRGYWILTSADLAETCSLLLTFTRWLDKPNHNSLLTRPKPRGEWGIASNKDWAIHLLQSFPGIGPEVATRIYDKFKGVPLQWSVTEMDLQQVPGVGPTRASKLMEAFGE